MAENGDCAIDATICDIVVMIHRNFYTFKSAIDLTCIMEPSKNF